MNKTLRAALLGVTALGPTLAFAQTSDCDALVTFVQKHQDTGSQSMTLDQARAIQKKNDAGACRETLLQVQARASAGQNSTEPQNQAQGDQQGANIVVQQSAPSITVEQASPQISVRQPQPNVTVQQQQPEILVHQPAPVVTIDIPQPEIVVRMPQPEVSVEQANPEVAVQQAKPQVRVTQPEQPQVQVQPGQAQVSVAKPDEAPKVQVEQLGQAKVTYDRAEPQVTINQAQGQPKVKIEQLNVQQQASAENGEPSATGSINANAASGNTQQVAASDFNGLKVNNERGKQVGTVGGLVKSSQDNKIYVLIREDAGNGAGRKTIALAIDDLMLDGQTVIIPNATDEQIAAYPAFEQSDQFTKLQGSTPANIRTAAR